MRNRYDPQFDFSLFSPVIRATDQYDPQFASSLCSPEISVNFASDLEKWLGAEKRKEALFCQGGDQLISLALWRTL